jgi:hypothetical protein
MGYGFSTTGMQRDAALWHREARFMAGSIRQLQARARAKIAGSKGRKAKTAGKEQRKTSEGFVT